MQSSKVIVSFAEVEQLEREAEHYRAYVMIGATNKIDKFVSKKYSNCLAARKYFGVLGDMQGDHAICYW
jgi:hypothetical protein